MLAQVWSTDHVIRVPSLQEANTEALDEQNPGRISYKDWSVGAGEGTGTGAVVAVLVPGVRCTAAQKAVQVVKGSPRQLSSSCPTSRHDSLPHWESQSPCYWG